MESKIIWPRNIEYRQTYSIKIYNKNKNENDWYTDIINIATESLIYLEQWEFMN